MHVLMQLPYRFVLPLPVRENEMLDFTAQDWKSLETGGLVIHDLAAEQVAEAAALRQEY